jgi:hypothetical protein
VWRVNLCDGVGVRNGNSRLLGCEQKQTGHLTELRVVRFEVRCCDLRSLGAVGASANLSHTNISYTSGSHLLVTTD